MKPENTKHLLRCFHGGVSELIFWSFRYFLGRRSAATGEFAEELAQAWNYLDDRTRDQIRKELEVEFARDDKMRANPTRFSLHYPLGADCDRECWEKVRKAYDPDKMSGFVSG